jgi:hypothetical protein
MANPARAASERGTICTVVIFTITRRRPRKSAVTARMFLPLRAALRPLVVAAGLSFPARMAEFRTILASPIVGLPALFIALGPPRPRSSEILATFLASPIIRLPAPLIASRLSPAIRIFRSRSAEVIATFLASPIVGLPAPFSAFRLPPAIRIFRSRSTEIIATFLGATGAAVMAMAGSTVAMIIAKLLVTKVAFGELLLRPARGIRAMLAPTIMPVPLGIVVFISVAGHEGTLLEKRACRAH